MGKKWVSTGLPVKGNNKRQAKEAMKQIISTYEENFKIALNGEDMLFSAYIRAWLDNKKDKIELSTWEGYDMYISKHIFPYFEDLKITLRELRPIHFVEFYDYQYRQGRCDGKGGMSVRSIRSYSLLIKESLDQAVIEERIMKNPASSVKLPKQEEKRQVAVFLDADEANRLLKAFRGHPLQVLIYVTLYYGLRRSEVLGLKWSAVNFKENTISICHTIVKNVTTVAKNKTKTAASNRTYTLLPEIKDLLIQLKNQKELQRRVCGSEYTNSDYIFTWPDGRLYRPDYVTRAFQNVLRKNGIPKMRFHDLRHSTASILYDKGWELKDIQTWLGHADIETTGNIYTHISHSREHKLARDLEHTFSL